jgi:hypothetical protein
MSSSVGGTPVLYEQGAGLGGGLWSFLLTSPIVELLPHKQAGQDCQPAAPGAAPLPCK